MQYDVTIIVHILNNQKYLVGYREMRLPFAPFIGMSIQSESVDFGALDTVTWIELESRFSCTISYERAHSPDDLEYILNEASSMGYKWVEQEKAT
ncbi:hypothetical protein M9194_19420 [Vibrio sp. S4M6]|uniref:hypothetical protein n=1 Tax=Vibrio sinus TaxID=2946865 RepID=UPI00202A8F5F|nr:hypothetical protein [Vibrio sinus]MCL9783597.1 hypothetical protein [Vibrio sinus]